MGYSSPSEWFKKLKKIISVKHPTNTQINKFTEFKATRDAYMHNHGIASKIYISKSGNLARSELGESLDFSDNYLRLSWKLCNNLVTDIGNSAAAKAKNQNI